MDRVLTKKGAIVELAIVTAGVLIALSFDGVRGWMHRRSLVEDARTNLATELGGNRTALEGFLKTIPTREQELERLRELSQTLLAGQTVTGEAALRIELPELASAAYSSAQLTGAFGSMDYREVSDYAAVYGFQANVQDLLRNIVGEMQIVLSRTWLIDEPKPPPQEVQFWRHDIDVLSARIFFLRQFSEQLRDAYSKVLARVDQR